jgi:hydrogenase nickel incorporation protein HypB
VLEVSARDGKNISRWVDWLKGELAAQRQRLASGDTLRPRIQPDGVRLHGRDGRAHDHHQGQGHADVGHAKPLG